MAKKDLKPLKKKTGKVEKKVAAKKEEKKEEIKTSLVGRPVSYASPEEMIVKIEEYFYKASERIKDHVTSSGLVSIKDPAPVHITGLCVHLGISRETLNQYQKKEDFSDPITHAKQRCEEYAVNALFEGKSGNKADFVLQNNFGWKNKTENETNGSLTVKTIYIDKAEKDGYEDHINEALKE